MRPLPAGIGVRRATRADAPAVREMLFLQMTNSLLGFTYDLAAEVRHVTPHKRGAWLVGLAFDRPLSPGELAGLI